jgi:hypothetical protein
VETNDVSYRALQQKHRHGRRGQWIFQHVVAMLARNTMEVISTVTMRNGRSPESVNNISNAGRT